MSKFVDLTGKIFGKLTVLGTDVRKAKNGSYYWLCGCSCEENKIISVRMDQLVRGVTKSCGCFQKEKVRKLNTTHGLTGHKLHRTWQDIKARINNQNKNHFDCYGGRGITYDHRWEEFENFYKDMHFKYVYAKKKYRKEITKSNPLTIERRDVNGNYCFSNCEFIPKRLQSKNRRVAKNRREFTAINKKTNQTYTGNNVSLFASKFDLNRGNINSVLKGRRKHNKGWVAVYTINKNNK